MLRLSRSKLAALAHALGQKIRIELEKEDAVESFASVNTTIEKLTAGSSKAGRIVVLSTGTSVEFQSTNDNRFTERIAA
jgi:hypothetical protein